MAGFTRIVCLQLHIAQNCDKNHYYNIYEHMSWNCY